ncbi:hypothetical protein FZEAL_2520 [Fusarium zealandicum]|uniref:Uncharacterized protein n=1 Tax=Fusarium zealandicum TaxID=1053134 RepID=A0A8H4URB1_9HYPO|nr:hypothetical protein FZEAL_2520 [Fusarium zealandicum]
MVNNIPATSIFELLTHPNPTVSHKPPNSKTMTRNAKWHSPKEIKKWEDIHDFNVLKDSFGGRLMQEARRRDRDLPAYPYVHPQVDCVEREEDDTRDLYNKWTKSIVTAALDPIHHEFHPAMWSKGDPSPGKQVSEPPPGPPKQRQQPLRKCSKNARKPKKTSLGALRPDSGSSSWDSRPQDDNSTPASCRRERFPKEYKPSGKWKSEQLIEESFLNESGAFERGGSNLDVAWPIRQAFSYCILHMCRYGCILTCHEAFIFRIRPRANPPGNGPRGKNVLQRQLMTNGIMEYISIPWTNHRQGDMDSHGTWTINLALWFMHILVGNNYEACWQYDCLKDETLAALDSSALAVEPAPPVVGGDEVEKAEDDNEDNSVDSDDSDRTVPFEDDIFSPLRKRKRDAEADDGFNLSFTKRPFLEV